MTLCQLFDVFHDRASVPTGIKELHLQIAFKRKKTGQIPVGQDTSIKYTGNSLILGVAEVGGGLKCSG